MSIPVVIRVVRPYQSADEYIGAEAWSIDSRTMLLVGARARPVGTAVRFDVALESGEKVIRAEGTVIRHVEPSDDRPGGLEVRFKKFGGTTKAFLDRAHAARAAPGKRRATRKSSRPELASIPDPPPPEGDELPSAPEAAEPPEQTGVELDAEAVRAVLETEFEPESGAVPSAESPDADLDGEVAIDLGAAETAEASEDAEMAEASEDAEMAEASEAAKQEPHSKPKARGRGAPIPPREDREELLERLRERARGLVKARGVDWFFSRSSRDG